MASRRIWRAAAATLLLVGLAAIAIRTAGPINPGFQQAHYCQEVEAYRLRTCARAIVPASPLGRQLRWALTQLAGEAADLTEAEVRGHVSAEYFAVWGQERSPAATVAVFQQTIAEFGTFRFVGFAYPPRAGQALALVQSTSGTRGALEIGVTTGRPARIEFLDLQEASPVLVPQGRFWGGFDIGGRRLFLRCTGQGSPTVVFEGGLTTDWYQLQDQLAGSTRVCSYDRPGGPRSRSDPASTPRTARDFVADLHALLQAARVPGPYVLVGHSNSGLFAQLYASTHPRQVAGLVLLDAVHPAYHRRELALLKPSLAPTEWEALRQEAMTPPHRLLNPEGVDIWTSEHQTRVALRRSPLRPMPLVVLAHGRPDPTPPGWPGEAVERLWGQLQRELANLVAGGKLVVASDSGHDIPHEQPKLVLDAINDVVLAVRTGDRIPTDERSASQHRPSPHRPGISLELRGSERAASPLTAPGPDAPPLRLDCLDGKELKVMGQRGHRSS
jgi:pimeloyl-ACP methyl ester carboxylesterase